MAKLSCASRASAQLFGANDVTYWAVIAIVWAICLPPLIGAYRAIANKRRSLWFVLFFLFIPFVPYALAYWLLEQALVRGVLDETVIGVPMLAIRGENSKLLSAETLEEMAKRHPRIETFTVEGQGHAPLLETGDLPVRIARFLENAERG